MSAAALTHDTLLPRAPGGNGPGVVLALLVHAALLAALTGSVDWRTKDPEVVSAELWASVPQVAAPKPVEVAPAPAPAPAPPPPRAAPLPTEADIATERAERKKLEAARKKIETDAEAERLRVASDKKRAEDDRKKREQTREQTDKEARDAKVEDERLARQREANLRRMMGQAGTAAAGTGTASADAAPTAAYNGRLVALIRGNLVFTGTATDNNAAEVEVSAAPNGTVIARRLVKSSGHKDWDDAVLRAIDRTPTLPRDSDGRVPPRLTITFKPRE